MSCPMASTVSGTTACWPVPVAKPTSRRSGTCWGRRSPSQPPKRRPSRSRSPFASCVPVAVGRCGSPRSFAVGKNRNRGHHRWSRRHDEMPIIRIDPPPVPVQAPHQWRLSETARTRGSGPVPPQSSALRITSLGKKPPLRATITRPVSAVHRGSPRRRPSFPIDGPRPPRLRPSEVCQRGPPPLGGWRRAAVHVEKPSGKPMLDEFLGCRESGWLSERTRLEFTHP